MLTVLKLTYANIRQKKFRSVLIILSIMLSVALMFTILSLSNSTKEILTQKIQKEIGSAQLMLLPKDNSGEQYIDKQNFSNVEGISFAVPLISAYGYSKIEDEMIPIAFTGMSLKDYDTVYGLEYLEKTSDTLTDNQVLIGKETADVYKLGLGDELKVSIAGEEKSFQITGIIKDQNNNLSYDLGRLELIAAPDTLTNLLGVNHKVSAIYIKTLQDTDKKTLAADLEASFPELKVQDISDMQDYKQMITMLVTSLFLMVSAVIMVSAFIIYSSFKIIAIERMPFMGTLRSIGATRKVTVRTLLFEAVYYGIIGGLIGNGLGVIILSVTMKMLFKNFGLTIENISYFNLGYFLIALFLGLGLAVGSAMFPIVKTSKMSIRSIIFSEIDNEKHSSIIKTIAGFAFVGAAFLIFSYAPLKLQLPLDISGTLLVTVGGAMVIPFLSNIFNKLLMVLFRPFYKDSLGVVSANIKNDRTMMNNIMLLAMGLGIILMINNFSSTVGIAVSDVYATGKFDVVIDQPMDSAFIDKIQAVDGVEHVYTTKETLNLSANDGDIKLMYLEGIDGHGYCEYGWNEFGEYITDDLLKDFKQKRSIILSRFTAKKYDLKIGDMLSIDFSGKKVPYEVIEIVPSIMQNGNMSYVYEDFLREDADVQNYQAVYLNISDSADTKTVMQDIKELMPQSILPIQTLQDMRDQNMKSNNGIFFLMKAISVIAMFIGIVGILNNFTISFLNRRKLFATMRSLGLSKQKTVGNMMVEAFFCGSLGTISGLILGTVLLKAMCYTIEAMGIPADVIFYNAKDYVFVLVSGIILSLVSAILPAISIARENIVAGLRYE